MQPLNATEARVLGVLIEKELTVPAQYPLTFNSLMAGCNQLNNRDPVMSMNEAAVSAGLEGLRDKGLVIYADTIGSRVTKYKHNLGEKMELRPVELSLLSELLMRGPQTLGELRGRASRMYPFESMEIVQNVLDTMMDRPEPLVRRLPPVPGSRAGRFGQMLAPDIHPAESTGGTMAMTSEGAPAPATQSATRPAGSGANLQPRVEQLEKEVATLRAAITKLATALGEADPFAGE